MKVLTRKEENLIKLAIFEGNEELMDRLWHDFNLNPKLFTPQQQSKLSEVFDVLYTTLCELVEDHGSLQSKYE